MPHAGPEPKRRPPKKKPPKPLANPFAVPALHLHDPIQEAIAAHKQGPGLAARRTANILRRQRLLKSVGLYNGKIDGIWGPQSQKAWGQYVTRRRTTPNFGSPFLGPKAIQHEEAKHPLSSPVAFAREQAAAAPHRIPKLPKLNAKAEAAKQLRIKTQKIASDALHLRADPSVAGRYDLHHLTAVLTADATKFDPTNARDVSIVQTWLNTHGHPVAATGKWDKQTNDALVVAMKQDAQAQHQKAIQLLTHDFYGNGRLVAGERPSWWPLVGNVPAPGELLKILQRGDFTADRLIRSMMKQGQLPQMEFIDWRNAQLDAILSKLHGPFEATSLTKGESTGSKAARVILASPLGGQAAAVFDEQIATLVGSKTGDEFAHRIAGAVARADAHFQAEAMKAARHNKHWWSTAMQAVNVPGEFMRTAFIVDFYNAADLVTTGHLRSQDNLWETAVQAQYAANPILRFGYTMLADPLIYLKPFRVGSTLVKYIHGGEGLGEALGGYRIAQSSLKSFQAGKGSAFGLDVVRYSSGTWHLPIKDGAGRLIRKYEPIDRLLTLKHVAVNKATAKVAHAARLSFGRPSKFFESLGEIPTFKVRAQTRHLLDVADSHLLPKVTQNERLLYQALLDQHVPLYADAHQIEKSTVGGAVYAHRAETIRVAETHRLAMSNAKSTWEAQWEKWFEESGLTDREVFNNTFIPSKAQQLERANAAIAAYKQIKDGSSLFIKGGGDPEITAAIDKRVHAQLSQFEEVIMPALHSALMDDFEKLGVELWDDAGKWVGRGDTAAMDLKKLGHEMFAPQKLIEVANPMWNKVVDYDTFEALSEGEIRRRQSRIIGYSAREEAAGRPLADGQFEALYAEQRRDVEDAWITEPDGAHYRDTRETLEVPAVYAKDHPESLTNFSPEDFIGPGGGMKFRQAAEQPLNSLAPGIDGEVAQNVWNLGSYTQNELRLRGLTEDPTFISHGHNPTTDEGMLAIQQARAYKEAVQMKHVALSEAIDEAVPHAMNEQFAFHVALQNATSAPLRWAYNIHEGATGAWRFATLPFRPAWVVRNVADNNIKILIRGATDPRAYFDVAKLGPKVNSIFEAHIGVLRHMVKFMDDVFGTQATMGFDAAADAFWKHSADTLSRIFNTHNFPVPKAVLENKQLNIFEETKIVHPLHRPTLEASTLPSEFEGAVARQAAKQRKWTGEEKNMLRRFRDRAWEVMGNGPENYYRKALYRSELHNGLVAGLDDVAAHTAAWKAVDDTLFDYSKITVLEDNLRVFAPFIQFWRKNTGLWARSFATKPYLPLTLEKYIKDRDEHHADWPDWMKRYVNMKEVTDALSVVPGLEWVVQHTGIANAQFDPLSFVSFSPYLRAFDAANPSLPPDERGNRFFAPMLDAINNWGLGLSPFIRKPLESLHIANTRSWQFIFPQTPLAVAMTREFLGLTGHGHAGDVWAGRIADWERVFTLGIGKTPSDQIAVDFDHYVQKEMVDQLARGETPDRARAESTIRAWFLAQNLWGYFAGTYFRKNSPEDFYMAKLQSDVMSGVKDYKKLTQHEKSLLSLYHAAGKDPDTGRLRMDKLSFDRRIEAVPYIEAYYKQGSYAAAQDYLKDHVEITQYVDPLYTSGKAFGKNYTAAAAMYLKSKTWFDVKELMDTAGLSYATKQAAASVLITPELQKYWDKNDTPAEHRDKMIKGEMFRHLSTLQRHYYAIPQSDRAARDGFLRTHPELSQWWQENNSAQDDYEAIHNTVNNNLREMYFDALDEGGFDKAAPILKMFPFMFDGTKSEDKVDSTLGVWVPGGKHSPRGKAFLAANTGIQKFFDLMKKSKQAAFDYLYSDNADAKLALAYFQRYGKNADKKFNVQRAQDFREAKDSIKHFFYLMNHVSKKAAFDWLQSDDPAAKPARDYFKKWGKHGNPQQAEAFAKVERWSDAYWNMSVKDRQAWLDGGSEGAKALKAYWDRYANGKGEGQHAHDYLAAKSALKAYFALPKAQRSAWLHSGSAAAAKVLDYFKKYSRTHQKERAFAAAHPEMTKQPEMRARIIFWKQYFALTPDKRPAFIASHARQAGIFVYDAMGDQDWHDREAQYIRGAIASGMSLKGASYLYVKPLFDLMYSLPKSERPLFIKANPELQDYLDRFAHGSATGNKALDKAMQGYFDLPEDSNQRSAYLRAHPEVQKYFDKNSSPAERAMRSVLNAFFATAPGRERRLFMAHHPEVQAYFDRKTAEHASDNAINDALMRADPWFSPFLTGQESDQRASAKRMADRLRAAMIRRYLPKGVESRIDRRPLDPVTGKPIKIG